MLFRSEVLSRSLKEEEPNPALFGFLHSSIQIFDLSKASSIRFHIHFMIQLTRYTGFFPNGSYSEDTPYFDMREGSFTSSIPFHADVMDRHVALALWDFMNEGYHESDSFQVNPIICKELLRQLVIYYELHLTQGKSIHSHKILADVMA